MFDYRGVILAGGKGERLLDYRRKDGKKPELLPKPLVNFRGLPIIDQNILFSSDPEGNLLVSDIVVSAGINAGALNLWQDKHEQRDHIIIDERAFPGSARAAYSAATITPRKTGVIITSGDEIVSGFNLHAFLSAFSTSVYPALVAVARMNSLNKHRVFYIDQEGKVVETEIKPKKYDQSDIGLIGLGILAIKNEFLDLIDVEGKKNWYGIFRNYIQQGLLGIYMVRNVDYLNLNTEEDIKNAE